MARKRDVPYAGSTIGADHGSVVMGMFPGRRVDNAAALFREIRESVQSR